MRKKTMNKVVDNNEYACLKWTAEEWAKWKEEHDRKAEEYEKRGIAWFDDSIEEFLYPGEGNSYLNQKDIDSARKQRDKDKNGILA